MKYTSKKNGKTYILAQNAGKPLRFFTQALKDGQVEIDIPAGYEVTESAATGMPMLKKNA
jgi:hypothetical protein